jgi:starch synthase (maltosyl-transferring)
LKIYNLFPLLAGRFGEWRNHLERAAAMGFDWVFVNPVQKLGRSASLYSIGDYFHLNPAFVDPASGRSAEDQLRETAHLAKDLGLRMMGDLVINHCAADSPLIALHPQWFAREPDGSVAHPGCYLENGEREVWFDLAQFDHDGSADREGLFQYFLGVVKHCIGLGFTGFRCDAAYQVPAWLWRRLIREVKQEHPEVVFAAETLGCQPQQTIDTAQAGFDYCFNSSKWWDFTSPWLMQQYEMTRDIVPSISFPESHDTERLFQESGGNENEMKQRYLFAALFSAAIMMPQGYEYGFRKKLHVVATRPSDWEPPSIDLTGFIAHVNRIKADCPVFREESVVQLFSDGNPNILLMWKSAKRAKQQALIVLNKDVWQRQRFYTENLARYVQSQLPLKDLSVDWPMSFLPSPFEFELLPGMARVLVTTT